MNTPNDNLHQTPEENNSLLDNLREPFQAWVTAGSRLGDVVSDFAGRFREDREQSDLTPGAHAIHTPVEEEDSTLGRLKAATQEARTGLSGASSTDDYRNVSATFASRAEDILRDLAASARRAAAETKDSTAAEEAKSALNTAVGSVRSTFDETVSQAKARRAAGATSGADNDPRQPRIASRQCTVTGLGGGDGDVDKQKKGAAHQPRLIINHGNYQPPLPLTSDRRCGRTSNQ